METKRAGRSKGAGSIVERSKGRFRIRYYDRPDSNGIQKQFSETVLGNNKKAESVLRDRMQAIETGVFIPKHKETVAEFLHRWLDTYAATNTTPRTQQGYRGNINCYILPDLGNISLQSLESRHIQGLYAQMLGRGLSPTSVVQVHRIIRQALSHAVKWGVLGRNVADAVTPPRIQRKELDMWDTETIWRFLDATRGNKFGEFYQMALLTGMRRSELCGLKWDSVDLANGRLSVVRTLQRLTGEGLVEGQPKTARSRRLIALSPDAVEVLHGIRGKQMESQLKYGEVWENTGYVFTQADGSPVDPDMISKDFPKVLRNAGLPKMTLHGLRHAHASILLKEGINPKIVSERLGHSTIATTMDVYSHIMPGLQEAAALALDAGLARPR